MFLTVFNFSSFDLVRNLQKYDFENHQFHALFLSQNWTILSNSSSLTVSEGILENSWEESVLGCCLETAWVSIILTDVIVILPTCIC